LITALPPISSIPTKIDDEKEIIVVKKFQEYRQFKVNWSERDTEGWTNYREKNYNEVILPMAIKSNIISYTNEHKGYVSFTDQFVRFMIKAARRKVKIRTNSPLLLGSLAIIEYYTTIEVANYLGLTYEEFYDLPSKEPDRLRVIFDLGETVHRLINSDFYERIVKMQEEQMKERAEFRKRVSGHNRLIGR
jgi:hypothetical protein